MRMHTHAGKGGARGRGCHKTGAGGASAIINTLHTHAHTQAKEAQEAEAATKQVLEEHKCALEQHSTALEQHGAALESLQERIVVAEGHEAVISEMQDSLRELQVCVCVCQGGACCACCVCYVCACLELLLSTQSVAI